MSRPFVVLGLPRSRTYWLSKFLSYGGYSCAHEQMRYVRGLEDVRLWLSQNFTGTAETSVAPWWQFLRQYRPDTRILVVRRPVDEVVDSLMRLDMRGVCTFDREVLQRQLERSNQHLDQVTDGLSVQFADLVHEETCARVFEYCLPYRHDHDHWSKFHTQNLQCDMRAMMRYALVHQKPLKAAAIRCVRQMRAEIVAARGPQELEHVDGLVIREEPFETVWRDGAALFAQHCETVGEAQEAFLGKNVQMMRELEYVDALQIMVARLNGRMFGYLGSIIGPSLESPDIIVATQTTFFVSPDAEGMKLSMRLERAAIEAAKRRGANEIILRAGVRGSGPRLGAVFKRLGAEEFGQLYRLRV